MLPQTARFAEEPEEPFQSAALHPARGLVHPPGVKIERGADAEEQRGVEGLPVIWP